MLSVVLRKGGQWPCQYVCKASLQKNSMFTVMRLVYNFKETVRGRVQPRIGQPVHKVTKEICMFEVHAIYKKGFPGISMGMSFFRQMGQIFDIFTRLRIYHTCILRLPASTKQVNLFKMMTNAMLITQKLTI